MRIRRVTLFAGHYGSGKTNIAVNYALYLRSLGKPVALGDLDIVNPYYRAKDSQAELESPPPMPTAMWMSPRSRRKCTR